MDSADFVYYREGKDVKSLGYVVDSSLLRQGLPAVGHVGGSKVRDGLVIPAGLFLLQQTVAGKPISYQRGGEHGSIPVKSGDPRSCEVISGGVYAKLLKLMQPKQVKPRKGYGKVKVARRTRGRKRSSGRRHTRKGKRSSS